MIRKELILLTAFLALTPLSRAGEIGFVEKFSLAEDRSIPLKQLIPGTEDYYYYHCLFYQHNGESVKLRKMLKQWIRRYNYTRRVREIQNRQALLEYNQDPQKALRQRLIKYIDAFVKNPFSRKST